MLNFSKKTAYIVLFFILIPNFVGAQINEQSENFDVNLIVEGCNNNTICEAVIGENTDTCPLDCPYVEPETEPQQEDRPQKKSNIIKFPEVYYQNYDHPDVVGASVTVEGKIVFLSWTNPSVYNFDFIRVTKDINFSQSPFDGEVVYEGYANNFFDSIDIFGRDYFYNIFIRYKDGSYSDGVGFVVSANQPSFVSDVGGQIEDVDFVEKPQKDVYISDYFSVYDLVFLQNNEKLSWNKNNVITNFHSDIDVYLPKKDFFGEIKDIYLYVEYYDNQGVFYRKDILKMDYSSSGNRYESHLRNLENVSKAKFRLSFIDENQEDNFVTGGIEFEKENEEKTPKNNFYFIIIFICLILILSLFFKVKNAE